MRTIFFIFFTTFTVNFTFSQTFNKRVDFGFVAQRPGAITPVEDGYIVTGIVIQPGVINDGLIISKLDLEGEIETTKSFFMALR